MPDTTVVKTLLYIDSTPANPEFITWFESFGVTILSASHPGIQDYRAANALVVTLPLFATYGNLPPGVQIPVIVLANAEEREACIETLEQGADDFLIHPVNPRELHARINAVHRRIIKARDALRKREEVLSFATFRLYPGQHQVVDAMNRPLTLSEGEFALLHLFARNAQRVLGREFLLQMTRDCDLSPFDRRIDVQISRLRLKIETNPKHPKLIKTIRNQGYLFTPDVNVWKVEPS